MVGTRTQSDRLARDHGWTAALYAAGPFSLHAYERLAPGADLTVYIESDGAAWLGRRIVSADPTPVRPFVLRLAIDDPSPSTLYLARPCQFLDRDALKACSPQYWTFARFAPEVIAGYVAVIDAVRHKAGARRVRLVGYSGGGAVAALVAATRSDVVQLVTIAGTLDHAAWTTIADVSPLDRSLNPADFAARLRAIPQVHFVGTRDAVVPPAVAQSYLDRLGRPPGARLVALARYDHECCWGEDWRGLLARHATAAASLGAN